MITIHNQEPRADAPASIDQMPMRKRLPFLFGFLIGTGFCCVVAASLALRSAFTVSDPRFDLVAVSWGTHTSNDDLWIYQVQVAAKDLTEKGSPKNGNLDVSARICLGAGNYFHDLGSIGTASNMDDATKWFGVINWLPDRLTIGGTDGVKSTLLRSDLQKHR